MLAEQQDTDDPLVISCRTLRRAIGVIDIALADRSCARGKPIGEAGHIGFDQFRMRLMVAFGLLLLFAVTNFSQSICKEGKKCCGANTWKSCSVDGCKGDKYLNRQKNRTQLPTTIENLKFNDMLYLTFYNTWTSGPRNLVSKDEKRGVRISAYLKAVKNYTQGAETANCNLKKESNNDFHLVLTVKPTDPEEHSITAEISPRIRPSGWTMKKLRKIRKNKGYVRVEGWLMFDSEHAGEKSPKRWTHWEIHPVTDFQVCSKTKAQCDAGNGWVKLEDYQ